MNIFIFLSLAVYAAAELSSEETAVLEELGALKISEEYFKDEFKIHTAENNIVKVHFPLNGLNEVNLDQLENVQDDVVFFVESDDSGNTKGVSVINNGTVTHLLPTGTSVTSDHNDTKLTYIGATDGLYIYNAETNKAEKYGTVNDHIIDLAKSWIFEDIYILTDKNEVYIVTDNGTEKELLPEVTGAKQIALDSNYDLFFYDGKQLKVRSILNVTDVTGLPESNDLLLLNPFLISGEGDIAPVLINGTLYNVDDDGEVELAYAEISGAPSALSFEGEVVMLIAKDKSIYKYNLVDILTTKLGDSLPEYRKYWNDYIERTQNLYPEDSSARKLFQWFIKQKNNKQN